MSEKEITSTSFESFDTANTSTSSEGSPASSNQCPFDDITLIKVINKAKFPVLLGSLPSTQEQFAVKLFPYKDDKVSPCFHNEIKFSHLRHKNVIPTLHHEIEREASFQDCSQKISYTIMELAPYGDLCELLISRRVPIDEKLARTWFHQIMDGLEYLHSVGVAHMDLKPDNILLANNYILKIGDFDQAHIKGQSRIIGQGTLNYRAPELMRRSCRLPEAADIYSAGILLFTLKCGGILPYSEEDKHGNTMLDLMIRNSELFWSKHCELQKKPSSFFDEDFKALFSSMVTFSPNKRASIENIKSSKWYLGEIYSQDEVKDLIRKHRKLTALFSKP